jgi:hypothetical protein
MQRRHYLDQRFFKPGAIWSALALLLILGASVCAHAAGNSEDESLSVDNGVALIGVTSIESYFCGQRREAGERATDGVTGEVVEGAERQI